MSVIHRIYAEKMGASDATTFIGNKGEVFYDPESLTLRISDGVTPGGKLIVGGGASGPVAGDIPYTPAANGSITTATVQAAIAELDALKLGLAGGTMTGPLILDDAVPTDPNEAISLGYLEDFVANTIASGGITSNTVVFDNSTTTLTANTLQGAIEELAATKLGLTGGTMTGELFTTVTTFTSPTSIVSKAYVDSLMATQDTYIDTAAFNSSTGVVSLVNTDGAVLNINLDGRYLPLSGGTLTGDLIINAAPTSANSIATASYVSTYVANTIASGGITSNTIVFDNSTTTLTANTVESAIVELDANKLDKAGDTMTGALILSGAPTQPLEATTKAYVDGLVSTAVTSGVTSNNIVYSNTTTTLAANTVQGAITELSVEKLDLSGGTMTGTLTLASDPAAPYDAATKQYVDNSVAASFSSILDAAPDALNTLNEIAAALGDDPNFANTIITQLGDKVNRSGDTLTGFLTLHADPSFALHAATKQYVDAMAQNIASGNGVSIDSTVINFSNTSTTLVANTVEGAIVELSTDLDALEAAVANLHLNDLVDVNTTTVASGQVLSWNGTAWVPYSLPPGATDTYTTSGSIASSGIITFTKSDSTTYTTDISSAVLLKTGGTLTGALVLSADPTLGLQAATKQYVDNKVTSTNIAASNITYTSGGNISSTTVATAIAELDSEKVAKAGDTMTGALILNGDPSVALQAATKQYVDNKVTSTTIAGTNISYSPTGTVSSTNIAAAIAELDTEKVAKAGDTMTGLLTLSGAPTADLHAATKKYVDDKVTSTSISSSNITYAAAGNISATTVAAAIAELDSEKVAKAGDTMTGALMLHAAPTLDLQAATKKYVDDKTYTLDSLSDVASASATNGQVLSFNGTSWVPLTLPPGTTDTYTTSGSIASTGIITFTKSDNSTYTTNISSAVVLKAGDTMSGALTLSGAPTANLHAATKKYVDDAAALGVLKAGDTMTGALTLSGAPTADLHAATKKYVDDKTYTLDSLSDVASASATNGQVLSFNGTSWVASTPAAGTSLPNGTAFGQNATWNGSSWDAQVPRAAVLFGSANVGSAESDINVLLGGGTNNLAGALYYDSTLGAVRYYNGVASAWATLGTGDVFNTSSVSSGTLSYFDNTTGKSIKATNGVVYSSTDRSLVVGTGYYVGYNQMYARSSQMAGVSSTSSSLSWDYAYHKRTLTAPTTFTFGSPTKGFLGNGEAWSMTVEVYLNGGSITWPTSIKWPNGTAPTLTNAKTHLIMLVTSDGGSTVYGSSLTNYA